MRRTANYKYYTSRELCSIKDRDISQEGNVYNVDVSSVSFLDTVSRLVGKEKEEIVLSLLNELERYVIGKINALQKPIKAESLLVMWFIQYIAHRSMMELKLYSKSSRVLQLVAELEVLEEKYMQSKGSEEDENLKTFLLSWFGTYGRALKTDNSILDVAHTMAFFQVSLLTKRRVKILNCTRASFNTKGIVGYEPFTYTLLDTANSTSFTDFHGAVRKILKGNDFLNPTDNALRMNSKFRLYSEEWWKEAFRLSVFGPIDYRMLNVDAEMHGNDLSDDFITFMRGNDNELALVTLVEIGKTQNVEDSLPVEPMLDYLNREELVDPPSRVVDRTIRNTSPFWSGVSERVKRVYGYDVQPFVSFSQMSSLLLPFIDDTGLDFRVVRLLYELCSRDILLLKYIVENGKIALEGVAEKREKRVEEETEMDVEESGVKRKRKEIETGSTLKTLFQACLYTLEKAFHLRTGSVAYHMYGLKDDGDDIFYDRTLRSDFTTKPSHHIHILFKWKNTHMSEENVLYTDTWKDFPGRMERVQRSYWEVARGKKVESVIANAVDGALLTKNGVLSFTGPFIPKDRLIDLVSLWVDEQKKGKGGDPNLLPSYIGDRGISRSRIVPGNILEALSHTMSNSYLEESPFLRLGQLNARMLTTDKNMDKLLGQYIKRMETFERVRNSEVGLTDDIVDIHVKRVLKFKEFFQTKAGERAPKTELEKEKDRLESLIEGGGGEEEEGDKGERLWSPFYVEKRLGQFFSRNGYKPPPFLVPRRLSEDLTQYASSSSNPFVEIELLPVVKSEKYATKFIKTPFELWLKRIIAGLEYYTVEGRKVTGLNLSILIVWSQINAPWVLNIKNSEEGGRWLRLIMSDPFNGGETFYPYIEAGPFVFEGLDVPRGADVAPLRRSRSVFSLPFSSDSFMTGIPKKMAAYLRRDTKEKTLRKFRWKKLVLDALYNEPPANIAKRVERNYAPYARKTSRLKNGQMRRLFALMGYTSIRMALEEKLINLWDLLGFLRMKLGNRFPAGLLEGNVRNIGRDALRDYMYKFILYCSSALNMYAKVRINRGMWWRNLFNDWVNTKDNLKDASLRIERRIKAITESERVVAIHGPSKSPEHRQFRIMYDVMLKNATFNKAIVDFHDRTSGKDIKIVLGPQKKEMSDNEAQKIKGVYGRFYLLVKARTEILNDSLKSVVPVIYKGDYKIRGEDSEAMKKYITTKHENVESAVNAFYGNPELYPMTSKLPRKQNLIEKMDIRTKERVISYIGYGDQVLSDIEMRDIMISDMFESDPTEFYDKSMSVIKKAKSTSSVTIDAFNTLIEKAIMTARYLRQKIWVPFYSSNTPSQEDMERTVTMEDAFQCVVRADFVFTSIYERILTYGGREFVTGEDLEQWDNMQMNSSPAWKIKHGFYYHNLTKIPANGDLSRLSDDVFQSFRRYIRYVGDTMFKMYVNGPRETGWSLIDGIKPEALLDVHLLPKEKAISGRTRKFLVNRRKTVGSLLFSLLFSGEVYHILQGPRSRDTDIPMRFKKRCELLNKWATFKIPATEKESVFDSMHYHPLDPGMFYTPVWSNVLMRGEPIMGGSFREHTNSNLKSLLKGSDDVNEYPFKLSSGEKEERNPFVQAPRVFLLDMWAVIPACYVIHYTGNPFKGYGCYFDFRTGIRKVPHGRRKKGAPIPKLEERSETKVFIGKKPLTYEAIDGCEHVGYSINYSGVFFDWRTAARTDVDRQSDKAVVVDPVYHNEYTRKASGTKITANLWKALVDYKIMLSQVTRSAGNIRQRGDIHSESFPVLFERPRKMKVDVVVSKGIVDAFSFGNETRFFNQGLNNVIDVEMVDREREKVLAKFTKLREEMRSESNAEKRKMLSIRLEELEDKRSQLQLDRIYAKRIEEDFDHLKDSNSEVIFFVSTTCTASVREKLTPTPRKGAKRIVDLYTFPYIDGDTELYLSLEDENALLLSRQEMQREVGNVRDSYMVGDGIIAQLDIKGDDFLSYMTIYDNDYPRCGIFIQLLMNVKTGFEAIWDYGAYYWMVADILFTYPPNHFYGISKREKLLKKMRKWFENFRKEIEIKKRLPEFGETEVERFIVSDVIDADTGEDDYSIVARPGEEEGEIDPEMDRMGKEFLEKMKQTRLELTNIREGAYMKEDKEFIRELKRKRDELFKYVKDNYPKQYGQFRQTMQSYEDSTSLLRLFSGDREYQKLVRDVIEIEEKKKKLVVEEATKKGTLKWFTEELILSDEDQLLQLKLKKNKQIARLKDLEMSHIKLIKLYRENKKQVEKELKETSERDKLNELEKELKSINDSIEEQTRRMNNDSKVLETKMKIKELDEEINRMEMEIEEK